MKKVRDVLGGYVREIRDVKVYDVYFDHGSLEALVEYLVRCELGEISAKLIYSRNPRVTLSKYYEHKRPR